jgi:hypothetical protein
MLIRELPAIFIIVVWQWDRKRTERPDDCCAGRILVCLRSPSRWSTGHDVFRRAGHTLRSCHPRLTASPDERRTSNAQRRTSNDQVARGRLRGRLSRVTASPTGCALGGGVLPDIRGLQPDTVQHHRGARPTGPRGEDTCWCARARRNLVRHVPLLTGELVTLRVGGWFAVGIAQTESRLTGWFADQHFVCQVTIVSFSPAAKGQ